MKNIAGMMKQAQQMKKNMDDLQARLENLEFEGTAGGEMVKITITGKNVVRAVKISPQAVDADDIETLEDLIAAAVNDAYTKVQTYVDGEMKAVTGGMNIPGLM